MLLLPRMATPDTEKSVLCWDNETSLSRWSSIEMDDVIVKMLNPIDKSQNIIVIPTSQKIYTYTESKLRGTNTFNISNLVMTTFPILH